MLANRRTAQFASQQFHGTGRVTLARGRAAEHATGANVTLYEKVNFILDVTPVGVRMAPLHPPGPLCIEGGYYDHPPLPAIG